MRSRKSNHFYNYPDLRAFTLAVVLCFGLSSCTARVTSSDSDPVTAISATAININTASAEELSRIPQIGDESARRIIAYREAHGAFRRPEHLMLVEGISEKRFRMIRGLIKTD